MRASLTVFALAVAACAGSTSSSAPAPASQTVRVSGSTFGGTLRMDANPSSHVHELAAPVDQVWRALPAVFDSLGIPVAILDAPNHRMGNQSFKIRSRLKGVPLSRYIDCGNSTQIGANADSYEVNLVVMTEVKPAEGGTAKLITEFQAMAKPVNFSQDFSACSSKGLFETKLVEALKARLPR
jgi:hypothetical protein